MKNVFFCPGCFCIESRKGSRCVYFPKRVHTSIGSCSVRASILRLVLALSRSCSEDGGSSPAALPVLLSPVFRRDQPSAPGKTQRTHRGSPEGFDSVWMDVTDRTGSFKKRFSVLALLTANVNWLPIATIRIKMRI